MIARAGRRKSYRMNIVQAFDNAEVFGNTLRGGPDSWKAWRTALKALFALPMDQAELELYQAATGRIRCPGAAFQEGFFVVGRRGGKSFISALIAVYLAVFRDWKSKLTLGERGTIMVISADRAQSRTVFGYVKGFLRLPVFRAYVQKELGNESTLTLSVMVNSK